MPRINQTKKTIVSAFSLFCILGFIVYVIVDIMAFMDILTYRQIYKTYTFSNIFIYFWFIHWLCLLTLVLYCAQNIWNCCVRRISKLKFYIFYEVIFICYAVLYFPFYLATFSKVEWIVIDFTGVGITTYFLMYIMDRMTDEAH